MFNIASKSQPVKDVRSIFGKCGIPIAEWARAEGFSTALVYQVIDGKRQCVRGQSHQIAVALGLKAGVISDMSQLRSRLAVFAANRQRQVDERGTEENQPDAQVTIQTPSPRVLPRQASVKNFEDDGHGRV